MEVNMADWFENYFAEQLKDPEFKALWDRDEPARQIVKYFLEHDIPFTQEFLDILDELTEQGVALEIVPIEKQTDKIPEPEKEYA